MGDRGHENPNRSAAPKRALGESERSARVGRLERRLRASREATRLIFAADSPESLIRSACKNLAENLGYPHAWIALLDTRKRASIVASEGLIQSETAVLQARIGAGACDSFIDHVVGAQGLSVIQSPLPGCSACPLSGQYASCAGLAQALRFNGRLFGVLSASVPKAFAADVEEQGFFSEMADDLAFALHRMERDEELRLATEIVNSSPTAALVWENTPSRVVRYATGNIERLLGTSARELVAERRSYAEFVLPEDLPRVLTETAAASGDPTARTVDHDPYRIVTRSGETKWVADLTMIERAQDGTIASYRGLLLDVTARKEAEEQLAKSERFLDSVVNGIADPIFVKDEMHRWIALNDAFCEMFGRTRDEMLGKSDSDFFPQEQVDVFWEHDDKVLASDEIDVNEEEITGPDGLRIISTIKSAFTNPITGKRVLVGTIRDITERKRAEHALMESEAELRKAQRIARLGTWRVNQTEGLIYASREMLRLYGHAADHHTGIPVDEWRAHIHPDDVKRVEDALAQARSGEAPYDIEYRIVRDDGVTRILHAQGVHVRDEDGNIVGMEGTGQDVTERRRIQDELQDSRNRLRNIFDQTFQFAGIVSLDGVLVDANEASLRFIDAALDDVVGKPFWLTPWWEHETDLQTWLRLGVAEAAKGNAVKREVTHISAKGDLHYFDFSLKAVTGIDGDPEYLIAESRDVTERTLAEERMSRLLAQQVAINALYAALGDEQESRGVYRTLHEHVSRMMQSEGLSIALLDDSGRTMRHAFRVENGQVIDAVLGVELPIEEPALTLHRTVAQQGVPIRVGRDDEGWIPDGDRPRLDRDVRCCPLARLLVPMKVDGSVMGVLQIWSASLESYSQEDSNLLGGLANVAAMAIEKARLQAKSLADAEALRAAFRGTIEVLARAAERRDPYTAGHQLRVALLSAEIARELAFSEERIETVRIAAMVHDIGKLSIPAEILSRPSELSVIELNLIRSHVEAACDILKTIDFPWPVADIVSQHHERLDGSGYPAGLRGDAIMIEAQILAVADVIEAMSHHRPYRPSLGLDAALAEVAGQRGIALDEDVVDACLRLFEAGFRFPEGEAL